MNVEILQLIEQALDVTLRQLHELSSTARVRQKCAAGSVYWKEDEWDSVPEPIWDLLEILNDPVKNSLKQQLNRVGGLLFRELGSTEKMREVAEWVAALEVENYEFRIDALDNAFLGVGEGNDIWSH